MHSSSCSFIHSSILRLFFSFLFHFRHKIIKLKLHTAGCGGVKCDATCRVFLADRLTLKHIKYNIFCCGCIWFHRRRRRHHRASPTTHLRREAKCCVQGFRDNNNENSTLNVIYRKRWISVRFFARTQFIVTRTQPFSSSHCSRIILFLFRSFHSSVIFASPSLLLCCVRRNKKMNWTKQQSWRIRDECVSVSVLCSVLCQASALRGAFAFMFIRNCVCFVFVFLLYAHTHTHAIRYEWITSLDIDIPNEYNGVFVRSEKTAALKWALKYKMPFFDVN